MWVGSNRPQIGGITIPGRFSGSADFAVGRDANFPRVLPHRLEQVVRLGAADLAEGVRLGQYPGSVQHAQTAGTTANEVCRGPIIGDEDPVASIRPLQDTDRLSLTQMPQWFGGPPTQATTDEVDLFVSSFIEAERSPQPTVFEIEHPLQQRFGAEAATNFVADALRPSCATTVSTPQDPKSVNYSEVLQCARVNQDQLIRRRCRRRDRSPVWTHLSSPRLG